MDRNISAIERFSALEAFRRAHLSALSRRFWAHFTRRPARLKSFDAVLPRLNPARRYAGIQDIPVERITGSVQRAGDFDDRFFPLRANLRERWVQLFCSRQEGWDLIRVYQVDDAYYVEDGNHRVSVARCSGSTYIQAEVWVCSFSHAYTPCSFPFTTTLLSCGGSSASQAC